MSSLWKMAAHWNGAPNMMGVSIHCLNNKNLDKILTVKLLARYTVTVLRIQRFLPAQLVPDFATVTAGFVASVKIWIVVVDLVGCSVLPGVVFAFSVPIISIVAIGTVRRCLFSHYSGNCVKLEFVDVEECFGGWSDNARCEIELSKA